MFLLQVLPASSVLHNGKGEAPRLSLNSDFMREASLTPGNISLTDGRGGAWQCWLAGKPPRQYLGGDGWAAVLAEVELKEGQCVHFTALSDTELLITLSHPADEGPAGPADTDSPSSSDTGDTSDSGGASLPSAGGDISSFEGIHTMVYSLPPFPVQNHLHVLRSCSAHQCLCIYSFIHSFMLVQGVGLSTAEGLPFCFKVRRSLIGFDFSLSS